MHFVTEVLSLQTLLAVVLSATLLTTAHSRLVTKHPQHDYEEGEEYDEGDDDYDSDDTLVLCAPNTYFNLEQDDCIECSPCPVNHLVIKPCHRFQDTLCMTYPGFKQNSNQNNGNGNGHQKQNIADSETAEWKSLAFVLFLIIALIVLGLITIATTLCLLRRRTYTTTKEIVCEYGPAPKAPPVDVPRYVKT